MTNVDTDGFAIFRSVLEESVIDDLRMSVGRLTGKTGHACVRGILGRSNAVSMMANSPPILALVPDGHSVVRSILFDKTEKENWPVAWHRDQSIAVRERHEIAGYEAWTRKEGFHQVRPPVGILESMLTLRIHLDDTGTENGALRVVPRSHRNGRSPEGITKEEIVDCPCRAGDILAMRPLLLHSSPRSSSPRHRRVIHLEFANREQLPSTLEWVELSEFKERRPDKVA